LEQKVYIAQVEERTLLVAGGGDSKRGTLELQSNGSHAKATTNLYNLPSGDPIKGNTLGKKVVTLLRRRI